MSKILLGAIEAGGTKILCALANENRTILREIRIATADPTETLANMRRFFHNAEQELGKIAAVGVGTFGPIDLDPRSGSIGYITDTPKTAWRGVDFRDAIQQICDAPFMIDTDVNAAALGESTHGAGQDVDTMCYVTIGTGIGVGVIKNKAIVDVSPNIEAGHIRIARHPLDNFIGVCPFHGDCLEGLASGPSLNERWGSAPEALPDHHEAWDIQAFYIAQLCLNLSYILRPDRIIIGGGVMSREILLDKIRISFSEQTAGYSLGRARDLEAYIVTPNLHSPSSGLIGALEMAWGYQKTMKT